MPLVPQNLQMPTFFDAQFTDRSQLKLLGLGFVVFDDREDYMPYPSGSIGLDSKGRMPGRPPKVDGNEEAS